MVLDRLKNVFSKKKSDVPSTDSKSKPMGDTSGLERRRQRLSTSGGSRNREDLRMPSEKDIRKIPNVRDTQRHGNERPRPPVQKDQGPSEGFPTDRRRHRKPVERTRDTRNRTTGNQDDIKDMLEEILFRLDDIERKLDGPPRR